MRIGLFDPYLDTMGGGEKYMLTIASSFSKKHKVSIFWDPHVEFEIKRLAKDRFEFDLTNVKFVHNIFAKNVPLLKRMLVTKNYDVIIYLSDGSIPFLLGKKNIIHFQFPVPWVEGLNIFTRLKMAKIDEVICNSYFTKTYIDKIFGINSKVIYPPASIIGRGSVRKINMILTVGRFGRLPEGNNFKKQDLIIKAFKEMVNDGLKRWDLTLVISIRNEDKKQLKVLKNLARGYPIRILENPKNDVLWNLYQKAKIYWHAAGFGEDVNKHPERAEHFGISTVEAMGAGAVPVVINAGGQREIVDDGENGFLWNELGTLKKKTLLLIDDKKKLETLSNNAQVKAGIFSKERFLKEIDEIVG